MGTCNICTEKFTKISRTKVLCEYCNFEACSACCRRWILDGSAPKCMNNSCDRTWTRKFISAQFPKSFVNNELKIHRENVLFQQEVALLPETQPYVEEEIRKEHITSEILNLRREQSRLEHQITNLRNSLYTNRPTTERREFVRECPDEECRGFLSTAWKCGVCEKWTCPDCHEIKGMNRDIEHTCNPDSVATAQLLSRDTKPCPNCRTGIFKIDGCFAENTEILCWDGTIKLSQNIQIGDELIGDDGNIRRVLNTVSGIDELYEVTQNKGINYVVNSKHKMVFKYCSDKNILWKDRQQRWKVLWFDRNTKKQKTKDFKVAEYGTKENAFKESEQFRDTLSFTDEIELSIEEYNKIDENTRKNLYGYKSSGINYSQQIVDLDPYILGLWLGDGIHTTTEFATNDKEILDYLEEWCSLNNGKLSSVTNNKYKYRISQNVCEDNSRRENPLSTLLKKYNLIGNKHIPKEYLINSRDIRLKLLAGIIDTDGSVANDGKRVVIIQTRENLSKQIIFLARSLGFIVNYSIRTRKNCSIFNLQPKDYKDQYLINISGDALNELPTKIERKKCINSTPNKDYMRTSLSIKSIGSGKYYGWEIDSNHRFILTDFTVVRNCDQMWCTQCHTGFNWRTGRIETNVHNPHFFEWQRRNAGNGQIPRTLGDNPQAAPPQCGNVIDHNTSRNILNLIRTCIFSEEIREMYRKLLSNLIRHIVHIREISLPNYNINYAGYNRALRIRYMRNLITEAEFKTLIQRYSKKFDKHTEIRNVIELLINTVSDIIHRVNMNLINYNRTQENITAETVFEPIQEIHAIVEYSNECFREIGKTYSSKPLQFNDQLVQNFN